MLNKRANNGTLRYARFYIIPRIKGIINFCSLFPIRQVAWPTINIRPHIMHFRRLVFSYTE